MRNNGAQPPARLLEETRRAEETARRKAEQTKPVPERDP